MEVYYRGLLVGVFPGSTPPVSQGRYALEPIAGDGRTELEAALAREGKVRCYYDSREGRLSFTLAAPGADGLWDLEDFRLATLGGKEGMAWLDPWVSALPGLEKELDKEAGPGHVLSGRKCIAIARRIDKDEVLFKVAGAREGEPVRYAVVQLTWSGKPDADPRIPATEFFGGLEAWASTRMAKDHDEFMGA